MKKILHILPSFNKSWGGPRKMVAGLSKYISNNKLGIVDICCTNVYGNFSKTQKDSKINIYQFDVSIFNKIWITHSNGFKNFIKEKIRNYDILHIHEMWHFLHYYSTISAVNNKIPFIITPHGGLEKRRLKNLKKKIFATLFEKNICDQAKYIHTLTEFEEKDVLSLCPRANTKIIPNGVSINNPKKTNRNIYSKYGININTKIILFLGRLHNDKGIDLLIDCLNKENNHINNCILIIAGPDENQYRSRFKNINNIIFTGLVEGEEKENLFSAADVFVLPSHGEGFSLSILEAMSYNIPVIISKFCYFPDVEKYNAGIIVDLNVDSLYLAINKLLSNDNLRKQMGANAFNLVKKSYDEDIIYDQIVRLYN